MLVIIVRSSSSSLPVSFVTDVFPVVVKRVVGSEDSAILQVQLTACLVGCVCERALLLTEHRMVESV